MFRTFQGVIAYGRALALKARALAESLLNGGAALPEEEVQEDFPPPLPPSEPPPPAPKQRVRRVYPSREVTLAAVTDEPQGVTAIAAAISHERNPTSEVLQGLVRECRVVREGKGRWTTYRLTGPKDPGPPDEECGGDWG